VMDVQRSANMEAEERRTVEGCDTSAPPVPAFGGIYVNSIGGALICSTLHL
jgi:hypothetical protein